jgi:hypothetical protein
MVGLRCRPRPPPLSHPPPSTASPSHSSGTPAPATPQLTTHASRLLWHLEDRCPRGLNREQREGEEGTGRRKEIFFSILIFFNYYFRNEFMRCFFLTLLSRINLSDAIYEGVTTQGAGTCPGHHAGWNRATSYQSR